MDKVNILISRDIKGKAGKIVLNNNSKKKKDFRRVLIIGILLFHPFVLEKTVGTMLETIFIHLLRTLVNTYAQRCVS